MLKLATLLFVVLSVSPLTAPFQSYDPSQNSLPVVINETDPGSLVAPLATETGRLTIALSVATVVVAYVEAQPPATSVARSTAPTICLNAPSILSTILRL